MKTKIIYISGGEVFAPSDVRGAFDEVRKMLNLAPDTVIFGVPVDADDVGAGANVGEMNTVSETPVTQAASAAHVYTADIMTAESDGEPIAEKSKRGRKKKEEIVTDPVAGADIDSEPVHAEPESKRSAPILSVLGIVKPSVSAADTVVAVDAFEPEIVVLEPVVERTVTAETKTTCDDDACTTTETVTTEIKQTEQTVTIAEPLDHIPTIEDIFAELEPLREEKIVDFGASNGDDTDDADDILTEDLETDATLTKMATEFAAAQDDLPVEPITKPGKIGKLKNILPFKKAKKEEPSVLGDLFGWAGIAANDDDEKFTVPSWALGNN